MSAKILNLVSHFLIFKEKFYIEFLMTKEVCESRMKTFAWKCIGRCVYKQIIYVNIIE